MNYMRFRHPGVPLDVRLQFVQPPRLPRGAHAHLQGMRLPRRGRLLRQLQRRQPEQALRDPEPIVRRGYLQ